MTEVRNIECEWCMLTKGFGGLWEKQPDGSYMHTHSGTFLPKETKISYETYETTSA